MNDMVLLQRRWESYLNEWHLFDHVEQADEFRSFTNRRVKEHSPFYVYGIWSDVDLAVSAMKRN